MSEDYKKLIEEAVTKIMLATGKTQADIATELGYGKTYISVVKGREGNKKFYDMLVNKYQYVFSGKTIPAPGNEDQALLKALMEDYIRLKSQVTGKSVDEISDELEKNTKIILRGLR